jgi:hypothetical protein
MVGASSAWRKPWRQSRCLVREPRSFDLKAACRLYAVRYWRSARLAQGSPKIIELCNLPRVCPPP